MSSTSLKIIAVITFFAFMTKVAYIYVLSAKADFAVQHSYKIIWASQWESLFAWFALFILTTFYYASIKSNKENLK